MHYNNNIPNIISKKAYYKILNKYDYLDKENENNFKIYIYSINNNLCKIIIRNNINCGWDNDIKINLYELNEKNKEIISLGSNDKNSKIIDFYSHIKIEQCINNFSTSQKIIQTHESNKIDNYENYMNFTHLVDLNTNIDYNFYDQSEQRKFINYNCKNYLDIYDSLKDNNLKNMIFICNYLFLNGGFYISFNVNLKISICELYNMNINKNIYLLNNNLLELLFCDKNDYFLINYLNKLINNDYTISLDELFNKYDKLNNNYYNMLNNIFSINYDDLYFKNIFDLNENKIIINGIYNKDSLSLEYLNLNYYSINLLNNDIEIDNNIIVICFTKFNKKKFIKLSEMKKINIKNEIRYIFSV